MPKPRAAPPHSDVQSVDRDHHRDADIAADQALDATTIGRARGIIPPGREQQTSSTLYRRNCQMTAPEMTEQGDPNHVWAMLGKLRIAMLTTQENDRLVSRPMASLARPGDGRIYFITRLDTGKVAEIGGSAPVNLAYADPSSNNYLSIAGRATTSQDRAKLNELWSLFAEAWLPEGPDAPDTALITVEPDEATLWNGTSSSLIQSVRMLAAVVTQSPPSGTKVEQVTM